MKTWRWGLAQKFSFLILSVVLVFLLSSFLIIREVLGNYALGAADELASTILDQTGERLADFFGDMEALARGLAGTRAVAEAEPEAMRDLFVSSVLARSDYLRAIYLGTADGRMYEWGVGEEFVDYAPSFPPGYDPRVRPWYRTAVGASGFSISEPYRYASVDDMGITCVLPVRGRSGAFAGVLGLDILLESLAGILEGLDIPQGGSALLLGADGLVIASQLDEYKAVGGTRRRFEAEGADRILSSPSGAFTAELGGRKAHLAYKRVPSLGWIVVVAMPLDSILSSMRELLNAISVIEVILMLALMGAMAAITGRLIVAPLSRMVDVMNRIAAGDKDCRVEVRSRDEFGVLGDEFNRLVDTVGDYSSDLEAKVRSRTEELSLLQRENAQLRVVEERRRIYRDMHDTVGAKLTNIFFCNGVARDLARDGPAKLGEMLAAVENNCLEAVESLRGAVRDMNDEERRAADLAAFVSVGMRRRLETAGICFDCRVRGRRALGSLAPPARDELEKILEELVSNVLRHSDASVVRLRLSAGGRGITLGFSDDGVGFDASKALSPVSGIDNIRYRVERLGGELRIESSPGAGASYSMRLPALGGKAGAA